MRALMIALVVALLAISGMPEPMAGQMSGSGHLSCLICVQIGTCHGFLQESGEACNEENRDENPSCRDCSEAPDGHIGCHVEMCDAEWSCSDHGGESCGDPPDEEEQEEQALLLAMAGGQVPFDAEAVGTLVARRADLRYDPVRGVIQRLGGCGSSIGSVLLQVPVPPERAWVVALVAERASDRGARLTGAASVDAFAHLRTPNGGSGPLVQVATSR